MKKRCFIVAVLLIIAVLLSACGFEKNQPLFNFNQSRGNETKQATSKSERKAATIADFKEAVKSAGYMEKDDFDAKYGSIIESDGYDSKRLIDATRSDGVVGYMVSEAVDTDDFPAGIRQYLLYRLYEINEGMPMDLYGEPWFSGSVSLLMFSGEAAAIAAVDESLNDDIGLTFTKKDEEHYSRYTAQDEYGSFFLVARIDDTVLAFSGSEDSPAYKAVTSLGY